MDSVAFDTRAVLPPFDALSGEQALEAFIFEKRAMGRSATTERQYREVRTLFLEYLKEAGIPDILAFWTRETILGFYLWMEMHKTWSQTTRSIYSRSLRSFLGYAKQRGWIYFEIPAALPPVKKERPALSLNALKMIMQTVEHTRYKERNKALVEVMIATGLRPGEVAQLELGDIDWQAGVIRVRAETSKARNFGVRAVSLGRALTSLYEYVHFVRGRSKSQRVFLNERGQPFDLRGIQMILQRIGKRAGLPRLSPKMFRHTFATQAAMAGVPMPVVQAAMGHQSISTTQIYFNNSMMQGAAAAMAWTPLDLLDEPRSNRSRNLR